MKDSLREKLHALIKEKGYLDYAFAVTFAAEEGYRLSNLERRMRELCNEYPIKPVIKKSKRNTNYIAGWEYGPEIKAPSLGIIGYNCDVCHGKNFVESGATITHFCEGFAIPIFAPKKEKENLKVKETQNTNRGQQELV